jgi:hypothetical protein
MVGAVPETAMSNMAIVERLDPLHLALRVGETLADIVPWTSTFGLDTNCPYSLAVGEVS